MRTSSSPAVKNNVSLVGKKMTIIVNRRLGGVDYIQRHYNTQNRQMMRTPNDDRDVAFFDSSAVGWILRLLFFPSGVITLLLVVFLFKRTQQGHGGDVGVREKREVSLSAKSGAHFAVPKIDFDREIERVCSSFKIDGQLQRDLELCGRLDSNSCGYCLGEGTFGGYVKLPCGHYHHRSCVRQALCMGVTKCIDCSDAILNVENFVETLGKGSTHGPV